MDFLNANPIRYALTINPTIYTSCIEQFWATVKEKTINGEVQLQALVDGKKIIITESIVRKDLQLEDANGVDCLPNATVFEQLTLMGYEKISQKLTFYKAFFSPQWKFLIHTILQCLSSKTTAWNEFSSTMASAIIYEAVNEEINDSLVRAATTASSLEAEQDSGNIDKTQSKATPNEPSSLGTSSSGGPRRQETIRIQLLRHDRDVSKHSQDLLLQRRVKKLERKNKLRTHGLKRLYKVGSSRRVESSGDEEDLGEDASKQGRRIHNIDTDEDITLVNDDNEMFDVGTLTGDEVLAEQVVAAKDVNLSVDEVTLAQALATLKSAKVQEKGDVIKEPSVPVSAVSAQQRIVLLQQQLLQFQLQEKTELVEESSKKAEIEQEESSKKTEAEIA
ncbi:hypothetical protein Tco_0228491 [Tanacetum coccineum]